tara:strand:- start:3449 stop:3781 length:333 start_codon:yes stop_codon:yes gene_type:complete
MDTKARVGLRIQAIRKERFRSQAELAEAIGRSVETVSAIERGKSLPNFETLERLARALDVPIREFFNLPEKDLSPRRDAIVAQINAKLLAFSEQKLETALEVISALERGR